MKKSLLFLLVLSNLTQCMQSGKSLDQPYASLEVRSPEQYHSSSARQASPYQASAIAHAGDAGSLSSSSRFLVAPTTTIPKESYTTEHSPQGPSRSPAFEYEVLFAENNSTQRDAIFKALIQVIKSDIKSYDTTVDIFYKGESESVKQLINHALAHIQEIQSSKIDHAEKLHAQVEIIQQLAEKFGVPLQAMQKLLADNKLNIKRNIGSRFRVFFKDWFSSEKNIIPFNSLEIDELIDLRDTYITHGAEFAQRDCNKLVAIQKWTEKYCQSNPERIRKAQFIAHAAKQMMRDPRLEVLHTIRTAPNLTSAKQQAIDRTASLAGQSSFLPTPLSILEKRPDYDGNGFIIQEPETNVALTVNSTLQELRKHYPDIAPQTYKAVETILFDMEKDGVFELPLETAVEKIAYYIERVLHHLTPSNPLDDPVRFMTDVAKYTGWSIVSYFNQFKQVERAGIALSQIYELVSLDTTAEMSTQARIDFIAYQTAEVIKGVIFDKAVKRVIPLVKNPLSSKAAVTPEGLEIETPIQPETEPTLLQEIEQSNNKAKPGSIAKIQPKHAQIFENNAKHIFRDAPGHIPDTPTNRKLLIDVASNTSNLICTDKHGTQWFAKNTPDGKQIWTTVRNNFIRDGGINNIPREPNPITGLSKLTPPRRMIGGK